ncbi:signal transducer and activator of transcription B [Condylostylus longicornis]|uniref:signal transducer and activator of transcription B n=1 Tax=Condylostylus longicornis TaxID=2530218 RepID=UPI00244DC35C|nr:signal transducer and activator of transcription B [Condylostylus longicornis]XP_055374109.1 signal transducer and activator of transcription B [Condylostylus longicornis]XP_055374110.1 signal transducer and activator of transcription B [Condylostylus longicornis]XP_055374111.1 signal transducer and activator of transcription B [Condylostylus longicornis]
MAATDGQIILAASRFGDTPPLYIPDFAKQDLPAIAKIVKGQHHNLGVPTLSNPSLQSTALFLSAGKIYKILAQPLKIKEGRKPTNVGSKVLIPESYQGYFELLSEDGRSTRCISTVLELSKRRNFRVLVRETFRCNHMNKTIYAGEILTTIADNGKILQCKTLKDEIVNLPLETKAKFSPIAKEDSISGVHSVKNLLLKRMPVIVRLVHGSTPKDLKQPFVPELRLLGCVEVDRLFALPLQKESDLVPVPLNSKMKLQRAKNMEQLQHFIEYSRFYEKAQRLLVDARDRIEIVDLKLDNERDKKNIKLGHHRGNKLPLMMTPLAPGISLSTNAVNGDSNHEVGYVLCKSASYDSYTSKHLSNVHYHHQLFMSSHHHNQQSQPVNSEIADEYNEIDHIYDYVRGLTPLSKEIHRHKTICERSTPSPPKPQNNHQHYHDHHLPPQQQQQPLPLPPTQQQQQQFVSSKGDSGNHSSLIRVSHNSINKNDSNSSNNSNKNSNLESNKKANSTRQHHNNNNNNNNNDNFQNDINYNSNNSSNSNNNSGNSHHYQYPLEHTQSCTNVKTQMHTIKPYYYHSHIQEEIKPVPPRIETIPSKKKLSGKRQRLMLPKIYL